MSGDAFKTVRPGDALQFPAELYNTLVQMAVAYKGGRFPVGRTPRGVSLAPGWAFAYNASGETAPAYALVELQERAATAKQIEFVKPGDEDGVGAYGIALEPIASAGVGLVAVAGGPHTLRVASGAAGNRLGAADDSWDALPLAGGPLVMVGDIVAEGGASYCQAVFAPGGEGVRVNDDDVTSGNLYDSPADGKLVPGTHVAFTVLDAGGVKRLQVSESGTRADPTQELRIEVRTANPSSPAVGRIWLVDT